METKVQTTIVLDPECWNMLAALARLRAAEHGGRPSQSAVIRDLVRAASVKEKALAES